VARGRGRRARPDDPREADLRHPLGGRSRSPGRRAPAGRDTALLSAPARAPSRCRWSRPR
jgi:hypothetical protein